LHGHVGNTGFAGILEAVCIFVEPHEVADFGGEQQTGIHCIVGFPTFEDVVAAHVGGRVDVAVEPVVAALIGRRDRISARNGDRDFVGAGFEAGEGIFAIRAGRGRLVDRSAVAGGTGEHNDYAQDTRFAGVLHTVAVFVIPDEVAECRGLEETGVHSRVVFARNEGIIAGHAVGFAGIAIHCVIATLVLSRCAITCWFCEGYFVGARFQIREQVGTVCVGGGVQVDGLTVAGRARQVDRHTANTGFARILNAVAVEVVPHEVAQRSGFEKTGVHRIVSLATFQNVVAAHVRSRVDIAVNIVVATQIRRGHRVSARRGDRDFIGAGFKAGERIFAVRAGGGGLVDGCAVAGGAGQHDDHAKDAGFADILFAIAVFIVPHEVAEGGGLEETSVPGQVGLTADKDGVDGLTGYFAGIAVNGVVRAFVLCRSGITRWLGEGYVVGAWFEVIEEVATVGKRSEGQVDRLAVARSTVQGNGYARNARFACILDTVAVFVIPNKVAQFGGFEQTCVYGQVGFAGDEGVIAAHQGGLVYIAVGCVVAAQIGRRNGVATRHRDRDLVGAGLQIREIINTAGVGRRCEVDRCRVAGGAG